MRIDNDAVALACEIKKASADPKVVLEATRPYFHHSVQRLLASAVARP